MHTAATLFFLAVGAFAIWAIWSSLRSSWPRIREVIGAASIDELISGWQATVILGFAFVVLMAIGAR